MQFVSGVVEISFLCFFLGGVGRGGRVQLHVGWGGGGNFVMGNLVMNWCPILWWGSNTSCELGLG